MNEGLRTRSVELAMECFRHNLVARNKTVAELAEEIYQFIVRDNSAPKPDGAPA